MILALAAVLAILIILYSIRFIDEVIDNLYMRYKTIFWVVVIVVLVGIIQGY